MKSLLEKVNEVDNLIRQMQKMESKMRSGQWIDAWRETTRILSSLTQHKQELIKAETEKPENTEKPNEE